MSRRNTSPSRRRRPQLPMKGEQQAQHSPRQTLTGEMGHLPTTTAPPTAIQTGTLVAPLEENRDRQTGFGPVLANSAFVRLWSAQLLSQMAQNTIWIVLITRIMGLTNSTTHVGVAIVSGIAPQMLMSGFAGVIVDRSSKRAVLGISNVLRVGIVGGYVLTRNDPTLIYVLTFISQSISQFFGPAEAASIPILVKRQQLMPATSLFNLTFNAAQFIPFGVGPLLEIWLQGIFGGPGNPDAGFNAIMIGAGLFYLAAAALVRTLPDSTAVRPPGGVGNSLGEAAGHIWRDIQEGIHFIRQDRRLGIALFQINIAPTFFFVFGELALSYAKTVLRLSAGDIYVVLVPAGIGLVIGLLGLGRFGHLVRKDLLISVGLVSMGAAVALMGLLPAVMTQFARLGNALGYQQQIAGMVLPPAMIIALVMGVAMALTTVPTQTVVLERATPEVRGRVLAMQQVIGGAIPIIPLLVAGPLADAFGVTRVLAAIGLLILLTGVWSAKATPHHS